MLQSSRVALLHGPWAIDRLGPNTEFWQLCKLAEPTLGIVRVIKSGNRGAEPSLMQNVYDYAELAPSKAMAGLASRPVFGIEVTDPNLAAACNLGNIDPQHGDCPVDGAPSAALMALTHPLPPHGACLVTMRPDLDAVAAMAVLTLRKREISLGPTVTDRVRRIDRLDAFRMGPWPGPRPLPEMPEDLAADGTDPDLAAVAAAAADRSRPLSARVAAISAWLVAGRAPADYAAAAKVRAGTLFASLRRGDTQVTPAASGYVATVISPELGALRLGYQLAPVVVALNPMFRFPDAARGPKFTIARWRTGDADLTAATAVILERENGWGGQAGIKGSPQDRPSTLSLETVIQAVSQTLPGCNGRSTK